MAVTDYDVAPIRPGAAPQLDASATGLNTNSCSQPAYLRMTPGLLSVLRYHFSAASRIEYANLADRVYTPGARDSSPIQISSLAEWKPDSANQRPAVLVDRLDQDKDMQNRGIGDQFMGVRQGHYAHFMIGAHVVHNLGGRDGEAEVLAAEVWRCLSRFAPAIREKTNLLRFLPVKIGKRVQIKEPSEQREHYSIPIVCMYGYEEAWRVTPLDEEEITAISLAFS